MKETIVYNSITSKHPIPAFSAYLSVFFFMHFKHNIGLKNVELGPIKLSYIAYIISLALPRSRCQDSLEVQDFLEEITVN